MRHVLAAILVAGGIGLAGVSSASALPAQGGAKAAAALEISLLKQARWYHVRRTSRRVWLRLRSRHACHYRRSSYVRSGRC